MNKKALAERFNEAFDLDHKGKSEQMVNFIFDSIHDELTKGNTVDIARFGKFEVRERASRVGRNPQTGEALQIAASKAVAFKPSKTLKDSVNN